MCKKPVGVRMPLVGFSVPHVYESAMYWPSTSESGVVKRMARRGSAQAGLILLHLFLSPSAPSNKGHGADAPTPASSVGYGALQ
jgi:hypothetical protein